MIKLDKAKNEIMPGAVCYVRVSTQEQVQGVSLQAQEERLQGYCLGAGLKVFSVIREDGVSAGKPLQARPGGQALLSLLSQKKITHVVAVKLDRLFRDAVDCLVLARAWDKAGVSLHLVDMGGQALNTGSAMGRLFLTMTAAFAELERNLIAERTAAAMRFKRGWLEAYASTPFGYDRLGSNLAPNPQEQAVLEQIRAWRQAGQTFRAIARELARLGVPTKKGGAWYAATVKYLLDNDLYQVGHG